MIAFWITWVTLGVATLAWVVYYTLRAKGALYHRQEEVGMIAHVLLGILIVLGWPFVLADFSNIEPDGHT